MKSSLLGIHHVTAITRDPQGHLDFYTQALDMRLAKLTVNFDDPGVYHTFFSDDLASVGTGLTFFPYVDSMPGKPGYGQAIQTSMFVRKGSLPLYAQRVAEFGATFEGLDAEGTLAFRDPDGMAIQLVEDTIGGPRPRFAGVTLAVPAIGPSLRFMVDVLGMTPVTETEEYGEVRLPDGGFVKLVLANERGRVAAGSVHHVAFRVTDDEAQLEFLEMLTGLGLNVSPVMDRNYFHSIYFREPGGTLFEIATDGPGFKLNETLEDLGSRLWLPAQYEPMRERIEANLPPLKLPATPYAHTFERGGEKAVVVFHGTGGDENSLVPFAKAVAPEASVLSLRGKVKENGARRFFRRFEEGVFDMEDLRFRADEIAAFLDRAARKEGFELSKAVGFGYSNGANIAWTTLLRHPESFASLVLFRPMVTLRPENLPDLRGKRIFVAAGERDPFVSPAGVQELIDQMTAAGAEVEVLWLPGGHELTRDEVEAAERWLAGATVPAA